MNWCVLGESWGENIGEISQEWELSQHIKEWYHLQLNALSLLWESDGVNTGEISKNENWVNPYKGMTSPSTQNLKTLGLRVFFLICCSTFSSLPNVGLRLTLEYQTIWLNDLAQTWIITNKMFNVAVFQDFISLKLTSKYFISF